jgi:hypothetical protein
MTLLVTRFDEVPNIILPTLALLIFCLVSKFLPFSICSEWNGEILKRSKDVVVGELLDRHKFLIERLAKGNTVLPLLNQNMIFYGSSNNHLTIIKP